MTPWSPLSTLIALALAGQAAALPPLLWGAPPRAVTIATLPATVRVAHRGGAREVVENSLSGLVSAHARGHAQVLDLDTRVLRDGTPVVMADATLERTTFSRGPVRALDARGWQRVRLRGTAPAERPPTVAEVLDRLGGRAVLSLGTDDPAALPRLARLVQGRGLADSVLIGSGRPEVARAAHRLGLSSRLWRSARQLRGDDPRRWRGYVDVLDVDQRSRDADVRRAAASGIARLWAHTVNTPSARSRMLRLGCTGLVTDTPEALSKPGPRRKPAPTPPDHEVGRTASGAARAH
ncbi:glycerophosphodiester phosphodiesterase family protein [Streptomyces sp. NPDC001941]|uniref:glycerophosphodiester phosphodiesterase n=1 Tax=Streptomyces sp. NPDC001941 TaxID=3154659 RepID=UPI00331A8758